MSLAIDPDVRIVLHTPGVIVASVRDDVGIVDVHWAIGVGGWSCTCRDETCAHISAVMQVTQESAR